MPFTPKSENNASYRLLALFNMLLIASGFFMVGIGIATILLRLFGKINPGSPMHVVIVISAIGAVQFAVSFWFAFSDRFRKRSYIVLYIILIFLESASFVVFLIGLPGASTVYDDFWVYVGVHGFSTFSFLVALLIINCVIIITFLFLITQKYRTKNAIQRDFENRDAFRGPLPPRVNPSPVKNLKLLPQSKNKKQTGNPGPNTVKRVPGVYPHSTPTQETHGGQEEYAEYVVESYEIVRLDDDIQDSSAGSEKAKAYLYTDGFKLKAPTDTYSRMVHYDGESSDMPQMSNVTAVVEPSAPVLEQLHNSESTRASLEMMSRPEEFNNINHFNQVKENNFRPFSQETLLPTSHNPMIYDISPANSDIQIPKRISSQLDNLNKYHMAIQGETSRQQPTEISLMEPVEPFISIPPLPQMSDSIEMPVERGKDTIETSRDKSSRRNEFRAKRHESDEEMSYIDNK